MYLIYNSVFYYTKLKYIIFNLNTNLSTPKNSIQYSLTRSQ